MRMSTSPRFQVARFHKLTGPQSLFERVRFIMSKSNELKTHGIHFQERSLERNVPESDVRTFDAMKWELMDAEVRSDTGKFVSSTWRKRIDGHYLWVIIGLAHTVKTVMWDKEALPSRSIVTEGPLYVFVEDVNSKLMEAERQNPVCPASG